MYTPKIGGLYKLRGDQSYYLITAFENPNMDDVRVNFKIPGTTQTFEYRGLQQVSDFLHSLDPISSVSSELETLAEQEKDLMHQLALLRSQRDFLNPHLKSHSTPSQGPDMFGGRPGGAATLHF